MERTSRGGGRVWTNLNESHEMRRNGEKFSWDLKVLNIPRDDEIPRDFSPINAIAAPVSEFRGKTYSLSAIYLFTLRPVSLTTLFWVWAYDLCKTYCHCNKNLFCQYFTVLCVTHRPVKLSQQFLLQASVMCYVECLLRLHFVLNANIQTLHILRSDLTKRSLWKTKCHQKGKSP